MRPARALRVDAVFHGWWIVASGAAIQLLFASLLGQAYGAYVVLLQREFGWSRTLLSAASSMQEAQGGLTSPLIGWLVDRFGPQRISRVGIVVTGVGFVLFSQVQSPLTFYLTFLVISAGMSMAGFLTVSVAIVQWFERRRSTAISLASAGFAVGGMVVPLTVLVLEHAGWRWTAFGSGLLIVAAGIPLTSLLRGNPEEMGLLPDGIDHSSEEAEARRRASLSGISTDFTLAEAMRERSFWLLSLGHASALFVVSSLGVHLVAHLTQSQGYTLAQASTVVFVLTLVFLIGNLSGGFAGDYVNKRALVVSCMLMHMVGLVMLAHANGVLMVGGFTIIHGLAWGWRGPQMTALRAEYFGRASFGKIMGVSNVVIIVGSVFGPLIAGFAYDITGNYRFGFDLLAVMAGLGSVFFILARKPELPRRGPYIPGAVR